MTTIHRHLVVIAATALLLALASCGGNTNFNDIVALDTGRDAPRDADSTEAMPDVAFSDLVDALDLPDLALEIDGLTPDGDTQPPDAEADVVECAPGMGGFGCPCTADGDCLAGFCVWAGDLRVCTRDCNDDCPTGWTCAAFQLPDAVYLCVSLSATLCRPCATAGDCAGEWGAAAACVSFGAAEGSFCGGACDGVDEACPPGTHCGDATTVDGANVRQCLPDGGTCACSERSIDLGLATPCSVTTTAGTCTGVRACEAAGLTVCDAATPADEICGDGLDQDCDGTPDDGFPDTDGDGELDCVDADDDGDGEKDVTDCATLDALVNHAAAETCNGIDDDCDALTDGADPDLSAQPRPLCEKQAGLCAGSQKPLALCSQGQWQPCADATYGTFSSAYAPGDASCNGVDNDCDGLADEGFEQTATTCGAGACAASGTRSCVAGQPKDSCVPGDPAASDATCDGVDDDCDGTTDDDYAPAATTCGLGACASTGTRTCSGGAEVDSCTPGQPASTDTTCNAIDDDCDGATDEAYLTEETACGAGACAASGTRTCSNGAEVDSCTPGQPALDDASCDAVDDDCDGATDDDYVSLTVGCGVGACQAEGTTVCVGGVEGDSCQPADGSGTDDACNGVDDDCDGTADDDYVVAATACGVGACASTGLKTCVAGQEVDSCSALPAAADDASCNGADDDCDGLTDEEYGRTEGRPYDPIVTTCGEGACVRAGLLTCVAGAQVDSCVAGEPAADDASCNGVDDDCNGTTDDGYVSHLEACGVGACQAEGTTSCVDGVERDSCQPLDGAGADTVCNGLDDDCDGLTDEEFVVVGTSCGVGACQALGERTCVGGFELDSCVADNPAADDATCDGVDDDCSGTADDDVTSAPTACGVGACARVGATTCVGGVPGDTCDPGTPADGDASCNAVDDDCNGATDDGYVPRAVACGLGACQASGTTVCASGTESDSCEPGDGTGSDTVCNGQDDDCDDLTDEEYVTAATDCGVGACHATGTRTCDDGVLTDSCTPGLPAASDATCDAIDDDCSGTADEDYVVAATSCGVGACAATGQKTCVAGSPADSCQAGTPAASDADCDAIDDDCNGTADEDYVPHAVSCGQGACQASGTTACENGTESDSCTPGDGSGTDEVCNGVDDDCDGATDEDYVVTGTTCGKGACTRAGQKTCVGGSEIDSCAAGSPTGDDTDCDTIDDNCDGTTDEGYGTHATACGAGACAATGTRSCVTGVETNTCTPGLPAASDATCNAIDDDCNGATDEDYVVTATACGVGACAAAGQKVCTGGAVVDTCTPKPTGLEVCNGQDDDCDGKTDKADPVDLLTNDAHACALQAGVCSGSIAPVSYCVNGTWAACDLLVYAAYSADFESPAEATCDGVDNDCDGTADDGVDNDCDDTNPCTFDACSSLGACGHVDLDTDFCPGGYCQGGACLPFVCQPEQPGCDGEVAKTCNTRGDGWLPGGVNCAAVDKVCLNGECVEPCGALRFDGLGDHVVGPAGSNLAPSTITVEAWVNVTKFSTDRLTDTVAATFDTADGGSHGFVLRVGNGVPSFAVGYGPAAVNYEAVSSLTIAANTWAHVAGQYDGQNVRVYVNGQLGGTTAGVGTLSAPTVEPLRIGGRNPTMGRYLDGLIDEVRISNTIRYTATFTPTTTFTPDATTLLLYRFTEQSTTTAVDASGHGYTGTLKGPSWSRESPKCHTASVCGNGVREGAEECDDGNAVSWDGCTSCEIGEFLVNSYTSSDQSGPRTATFADGRFAIVWQSGEGSGLGVGAQIFDSSGLRSGAAFQVNSYTTGDQANPEIAVQPDGQFVVTWNSNGQDGSDWGVYAQRYTQAGVKVGGEMLVAPSTALSQSYPAVTALPTGRFAIVWQTLLDASNTDVRGQMYSSSGSKDGGDFALATDLTYHQSNPRITTLTDGRLATAWINWNPQDGSEMGINAQVFNADASRVGSELRVNTFTEGNQQWPDIAPLADGGFVVGWQSLCGSSCASRPDSNNDAVYAQRYDSAGVRLGGEFLMNTYTTDHQNYVRLAGNGDGRFVAVWNSMGQDGSGNGVYGQRFAADGSKSGAEFRVNRYTANNQVRGNIATFVDGRFVVAYQSDNQDGSGIGIYARLYDADGQPLLPGDPDRDGMPNAVDLDDDGDGDPDTTDCAPLDAEAFHGAEEVCDARDNDCDGTTDQGLTLPADNCNSAGVCAGAGIALTCTAGQWTCDYSAVADYEAAEATCDGRDNDCDGTTDDGAGALCDDTNACTDDTCEGGLGCLHADNAGACTGGFCRDGACIQQICQPEQPACDGNLARTCNADGTGYLAGAVDCTVINQVCLDGACADACRSLHFDGSTTYVEGPAGGLVAPATFTVEAWVKPYTFGSVAERNVVATDEWQGGGARGFVLLAGDGHPQIKLGTGSAWVSATAATALTAGQWAHLAGVYDGATLSLYVNGALAASKASAALAAPSLSLRVGDTPMGGRAFHGLVDEVRVSNVARYTVGFVPPNRHATDASTLLLYRVDETSGTTTADASGHGYTGTLTAATRVNEGPGCAVASCTANEGSCDGAAALKCNAAGTAQDLQDTCSAWQTCSSGVCTGSGCCTDLDCDAAKTCVADPQASWCTMLLETFDTSVLNPTNWAVRGSAVFQYASNLQRGWVELTPTYSNTGALWYRKPVSYCGLRIQFSWYIYTDGGYGAAVVLQDGGSTTALGTGLTQLGAGGLTGLSVRLGFYHGQWLPVRLVRNSDNAVLCEGTKPAGPMDQNLIWPIIVDVTGGRVIVKVGQEYLAPFEVLNCDASAYLPVGGGIIGWTGATGPSNYHAEAWQTIEMAAIYNTCGGEPGGVCQ